MFVRSRNGLSRPHVPTHLRDLLGVAVYFVVIGTIAALVYTGVQAAAPVIADEVFSDSAEAMPAAQASAEGRALSNFEQWLADQEAAKRPKRSEVAKTVESRPVVPVASGIAAAARARAKAEIAAMGGRNGNKKRNAKGNAALPREARPAEQTDYVPPPAVNLHRVY